MHQSGNGDGLMPEQVVSVSIRMVISPNHQNGWVGHCAKCQIIPLHLDQLIIASDKQGAMARHSGVSMAVAFATKVINIS